jgi:uncharacterized protein (TIGR03437 family)
VILRSLFFIFCSVFTLEAQYLGIAVSQGCTAGTCPAQPLAYSGTASLPVATSVTFPDGDVYEITGTLTSTNNSNGASVTFLHSLQVVFVSSGYGVTITPQTDTLIIDIYAAFASALATASSTANSYGVFGPTLVSGSSAQLCVGTSCGKTATSPAGPTTTTAFTMSAPFTSGASSGQLSYDYTFTLNFASGSPTGSYIYLGNPAIAAPAIRQSQGVISASSYGALPAVGPGTWMEIYGTNLGPGPRTWGNVDFNGIIAPLSLAGTQVTIGGLSAYVEYVSSTQVNAQVPSTVATGTQTVTVTTPGGTSAPFSVTVNALEPALLAPSAFDISGTQYVVALSAAGSYILPPGAISGVASQRATTGQTIILYGVGFGPVTPAQASGEIISAADPITSAFTLSIGGMPATIAFAGLVPDYVGLYQFNVVVPSVAASDKIPVTFTLAGTPGAQTLYTSVSN